MSSRAREALWNQSGSSWVAPSSLRKMASALGVSETHLRHLQRQGVVPAPERDTANRRKWMQGDLPKLKKLVAKHSVAWRERR